MRSGWIAVLLALATAGSPAAAQEPPAATDEKALVVGTRHVPPFALKAEDGTWQGISIDLWEDVAGELGLRFEYRDMSLAEMLQSLADGSADAVVAALTVTPEREREFDFTHAFHTSGLGVAVAAQQPRGWTGAVGRFFSWAFVRVVGSLALLLLVVGAVVWAVERKKNPEQFGGPWHRGIASGFWWSAVTMTTVGYGDKAPKTAAGRLMAMVWMFAAIILISTFTATIAASLTVSVLDTASYGIADLPKIRVATVKGSTSAEYLTDHQIAFNVYPDAAAALKAIRAGEIDAVVYDAPILRYLISNAMTGGVAVLPQRLERQDYAIGLPQDSPLREPVNRALIERIRQPDWQDVLEKYLGPQ